MFFPFIFRFADNNFPAGINTKRKLSIGAILGAEESAGTLFT